MRFLEEKSERQGISKLQLMENAGKCIYTVIKERFPDLKGKKVLVACYHGNNSGDGFVVARYLCEECETDVLFVGDETKFKEEAKDNFKKIEHNDLVQLMVEPEQLAFDYDIIIDALLGTGSSGKLKEPISSLIDRINESAAFKISIDIPSGLDPDTGEVFDKMIGADLIVTFHDLKNGLEKFKDKVIIVDIGLSNFSIPQS